MSDDLFKAVRAIDLLDHIQRVGDGTPTNPNSATTHINPCPLCGHNDCFTFYKDTNSFKCFSCDKAGDIINFERYRLGLDSNLAAAQSLARQYGIDERGPTTPPPPAPPDPANSTPVPARPTIDRDRARALRNLMTDWYHASLMADNKALDYQTTHRGHRIETLRTEKVGYAKGGWAFAKHARASGYTDTDLYAVGLIEPEKKGKKFYPVVSDGVYIHPHRDAAGNTLHWTLKDPNKEKKWQIKKDAADPDWLTLGQTSLETDGDLWLVEGENDRLALLDQGEKNVVAIIGNSKVAAIKKKVRRSVKGRTVFLALDPDQAGEKYETQFVSEILSAGGVAKTLVPSLKQWADDIDGVLRRAENPAGLLAEMKNNAEVCAAPEPKKEKPDAGGADPPDFSFKSFQVLGEKENNDIVFWAVAAGKAKTYEISIKNLTLDQLIQIGGREVAYRVCRTSSEHTKGMILFTALKKEIIITAGQTQLGRLRHLGQGIHALKRQILLVNGKSGWLLDGNGTTLTPHAHPIVEKNFLQFEEGADWIDIDALNAAIKTMTRDKAHATLIRFLEILNQWTFSGAMDRLTIAGFVLAQIVQSIWDWRPHLWLTGATGSGKSRLLELLKAIFGDFLLVHEGPATSEAGLRQAMTSSMRMTYIDEFEESKDRDKIIDILRSCGRSPGQATKGSATGRDPLAYRLRHMVMVCSVEVKLARAAEKYRYLVCRTRKVGDHVTPQMPTSATCDELKIGLTALALWGIREAMALVKNCRVLGQDTRFVESVAVPYALLAVCTDDPAGSLAQNLKDYLAEWEATESGTVLEDEDALVQDLLLSNIRVSVMQEVITNDPPRIVTVDRTVAQILEQDPIPEDHHKALQAAGVKLERHDTLSIHAGKARRELLRHTRWAELNIRDILIRIPGATNEKTRMAGASVRAVQIPPEIWRAIADHKTGDDDA